MTKVYITIDTEYSAGMAKRLGPDCQAANYAASILGETPDGNAGIVYQMDCFDRWGLKAVFFVDPMPALLWGVGAIAQIVEPIVSRGHDVQLHFHSEWLALAGPTNPLGSRTGLNIKDFTFEEQCQLLGFASSTLMAAGALAPMAFRAGNYGANDDTLRALASLGMSHDSSHSPGITGGYCAIGLGPDDRRPTERCGVIEVPACAIGAPGGGLRHAQITALSAPEMLAGIAHAQRAGLPSFTLVSHSFELLSRDRSRINRVVRRRFLDLCQGLAAMPGVSTATYASDPPCAETGAPAAPVLPHRHLRTARRLAEQAFSNTFYGAK